MAAVLVLSIAFCVNQSPRSCFGIILVAIMQRGLVLITNPVSREGFLLQHNNFFYDTMKR